MQNQDKISEQNQDIGKCHWCDNRAIKTSWVSGIGVIGDCGKSHAPRLTKIPGASRNDPCPCGSGKKFKKCCRVSSDTQGINVEHVH